MRLQIHERSLPARRVLEAVRAVRHEWPLLGTWPAEQLLQMLEGARWDLEGERPPAGEVIALELDNNAYDVLGLLLILELQATCLAVPAGTPDTEIARLQKRAGCTRQLCRRGDSFGFVGKPAPPTTRGAGVLLQSSGSAGEPKLVWRSEASLVSEAGRYAGALQLGPPSHVLLLAPASHAYALGWLVAALCSGTRISLVLPTHLSEVVELVGLGADWLVLTPALARLLARRAPMDSLGAIETMAGAGPIDDALEASFVRRFGRGLARNYGSTETGALFAGHSGLPAHCVGFAMPGVDFRIVDGRDDPVAVGGLGELHVRVDGEPWYRMGDIASVDGSGRLFLHGRVSRSARRGDQWVSTMEVESVASQMPGVRAARASAIPGDRLGEDRLALEIWPEDPGGFKPESFLPSLRSELMPAKWPDQLVVRSQLRRSPTGKLCADRVFRLAPPAALLEAATAYKRSELFFALLEAGVIERLAQGGTAGEIAGDLDLDYASLEIVLESGERLGLLHDGEAQPEHTLAASQLRLLELERMLSHKWVTRDAIRRVLAKPLPHRDTPCELDSLLPLYQAAMHGELFRYRQALGLRLLRPVDGQRFLELTSGPGDYIAQLLEAGASMDMCLWRVGRLAGSDAQARERFRGTDSVVVGPPRDSDLYDRCIAFNAIHDPDSFGGLSLLWKRISPGGRLVVDDLFLTEDIFSGNLLVDWLTHGGLAYRRRADIVESLEALGAELKEMNVEGAPHVGLILAIKKE